MTEHVRTRQPEISRRHAIIGIFLAGASTIAFARRPQISRPAIEEKTFQAWVPRTFAGWAEISESGVVLPPPDTLRDRLYDNLATRVYRSASGAIVMLLLAYNNSQDGILMVHRPEVCYPVGGFKLSDPSTVALELNTRHIPCNVFTATGPDRVEEVMYFTRLGTAFPNSWAEQKFAVAKANIEGNVPDGMLARVSMIGVDRADAVGILREFLEQFVQKAPAKLQHLLVG